MIYNLRNVFMLSVLAAALGGGDKSYASGHDEPNFTKQLNIPGRQSSTTAVYIYDIAGDSVLCDIEADRLLTPASITKAFTTASALNMLDSVYQFNTKVELVGRHGKNGIWDGDLRVTAGGDPTLQSAQFEEWNGICDSVASRLSQLGIRRINGIVQLVDTMPDAGPAGTWSIEDVPHAYGAGHFDFNWRDNCFKLTPATGATEPYIPGLQVKKVRSKSQSVRRGADSETVVVSGPRINDHRYCVTTTMPDPALAFEYELVKTLEDNGIMFGEDDSAATVDSPVTELYTHKSAPLKDVMRNLMHRSDNMFAEGVLRAIAPGQTREEAVEKELSLWRERGVDVKPSNIIDGSGLSRANNMSARFLGDVLLNMIKSEYGRTYLNLFPVAGRTGTVKSFMLDTPLEGRLALKTGSMKGIQSYAGYALNQENGDPTHVVVVISNKFSCSRQDLRAALSDFLVQLLINE